MLIKSAIVAKVDPEHSGHPIFLGAAFTCLYPPRPESDFDNTTPVVERTVLALGTALDENNEDKSWGVSGNGLDDIGVPCAFFRSSLQVSLLQS